MQATSVLVVGDALLDVYVDGEVERISPEAPVPVVHETGTVRRVLGGAANVTALGAKALLAARVGDDEDAGCWAPSAAAAPPPRPRRGCRAPRTPLGSPPSCADGQRVVFANGCFDLLHAGHVQLLQAARAHGDVLVVGLNSDASVARLKGPSRPVATLADRAAVIGALTAVDYVCAFEEDTPLELIVALEPDVLVKGGEYRPEDVVGGAEAEIVPLLEGRSATRLLTARET